MNRGASKSGGSMTQFELGITGDSGSEFVSARTLAERWQCSRSSVDRIARRAGLSRFCLGDGKNGMVRFLRREVVAYEAERQTA